MCKHNVVVAQWLWEVYWKTIFRSNFAECVGKGTLIIMKIQTKEKSEAERIMLQKFIVVEKSIRKVY